MVSFPQRNHQILESSMSLSQEDKEHKVKVLIREPRAMAKQRLMDFAASLPPAYDESDDEYREIPGSEVTYTELMERAKAYQESGEYWSEGGRFEGTSTYQGFWDDYALVTGEEVDKNSYGFFSCSC